MATTSATPEVVPTAAAAAAAAAATATAGSVAAVAALVGPPAAAAGQKLAPAPGGSGGLVSSSIGAGLGTSVAVTASTVAVAAQVLDSEDPPLLFAVLAGGLAGGAADFALHSVDTVKTRLQGQPLPLRYVGTWHAFSTIHQQEGLVRGLYSGLSSAMLASIPSTMTYFFTYEVAKRKLTQYMPDPVAHFLSGAFGDLVACSISMPAEVIKVRLQMQGRHDNPLQLTPYNYRNARDAFRTIYQTEGVAALFQGYRATITRDMPFSAIQFAIYEYVKALLVRGRDSQPPQHQPSTLAFGESLLAGAMAGGLAGALTTPLDVVKTQLQSDPVHMAVAQPIDRGVIRSMRNAYRLEGMRGLFRGVVARVMWTIPQSSILFVAYESLLSAMLLSFPDSTRIK